MSSTPKSWNDIARDETLINQRAAEGWELAAVGSNFRRPR